MDTLLIGGIVKLLDKGAAIVLTKILRKYNDRLYELDKKILEANQAFLNNTDNRDDLEWVALIKERALTEAALKRDVIQAGDGVDPQ